MKYHISPSTGNPNKCYAHKKPCPVGGESEHYPSKEAAREAYEKKQETPKTFASLKKNPHDYGLDQEDLARVDAYIAGRKKNGHLDLESENSLRGSLKGSMAAAHHLEKTWGRKAEILNGGIVQRVPIPDSSAEVEVQGSSQGKVYFRVLDRMHRTGYDPHEKTGWTVAASPTSAATVQRTVEGYMKEFKQKQAEGQERVRRYNEQKAKDDAAAAAKKKQEAAAAKAAEASRKTEPVKTLQGPTPEIIKIKYNSSMIPSYKCTSCGNVDSNMMNESEAEGFDGYSPCCNEPMMSVQEKTPPIYETTFSSRDDAYAFTNANSIGSFMVYEEDGKHKVSSALPGFTE